MRSIVICALIPIVLSGTTLGMAEDLGEADAVIKYRKDAMASVGGHIRAMVANLKGEIDDPEGLVAHANALAAATDPNLLKRSFMQNTDGLGSVETTATAKVWEDWDDFAKQIDLLAAASTKVAEVANDGDLSKFDQLKPVLATCGACHRELGFRKRK